MSATCTFKDAVRHSDGLLTAIERKCLIWLAIRMPSRVHSDHLTALALFAMLMAGVSYWAASRHPMALVSAVCWLAVNWFGDSLDGTLARVRGHQRPRYGFYVDHVLDTLGALFALGGLALSGFMTPFVAAAILIAYYIAAIESYLATYCVGTFHMSFCKCGPTELRIILAIGTLRLLVKPMATLGGETYRLFDVGGAVAVAGLIAAALVSTTRHTRMLYSAEPLPAARTGASRPETRLWRSSARS